MIERMKLLVNTHACISTYLQIDQDSSSRRDDSSSKYVSRFQFHSFAFLIEKKESHESRSFSCQEIDV